MGAALPPEGGENYWGDSEDSTFHQLLKLYSTKYRNSVLIFMPLLLINQAYLVLSQVISGGESPKFDSLELRNTLGATKMILGSIGKATLATIERNGCSGCER